MKITNSFKLIIKRLKPIKAFTLIELLVVIAIIGILASVVVVNVGSARVKARDAKRISDTKNIITALNMYYDDNNKYPSDCSFSGNNFDSGYWCYYNSTNTVRWNALNSALASYISNLPKDPLNQAEWAFYGAHNYTVMIRQPSNRTADGICAMVVSTFENPTDSPGAKCLASTYNYTVTGKNVRTEGASFNQ